MRSSPRAVCHHRGDSPLRPVTSFHASFGSHQLVPNARVLSRVPLRTPRDIESSPLLRLLWVTVSQLPLVCDDMTVWGSAGQVCRTSLHWIRAMSCHGWTGPMASGAEPQGAVRFPSPYGGPAVNVTYCCAADLSHLAEVLVARCVRRVTPPTSPRANPGCRPVSTAHTLGGGDAPEFNSSKLTCWKPEQPGGSGWDRFEEAPVPSRWWGAGTHSATFSSCCRASWVRLPGDAQSSSPVGVSQGPWRAAGGGAGCPRALPPGSLSTPFWNTPASLRSLQIGDQGARCGDLGGWSLLRANPRPQAVTEGTVVATPNPDLCAD